MEGDGANLHISSKASDSNQKKQTYKTFEHVSDILSPLEYRWAFIQDVLKWSNLELSVLIFNTINVLFWCFLTPYLKKIVIVAFVLSLLLLLPPIRDSIASINWIKKQENGNFENTMNNDDQMLANDEGQNKSCEKNIFSYKEFCFGLANILDRFVEYWKKLKTLKAENAQKFYLVISFLGLFFAIVYTQFPMGNILYLTVTFLYLWPAIVFYGVKDKVLHKARKLLQPLFTQWENSRTKRKRNVQLEVSEPVSDDSDDDEFNLNTAHKQTFLVSPITPDERIPQEPPMTDPLDSSLTFVDGLEFPSFARRDSADSVNSDDFVQGLNFNNFTPVSHQSSIDSIENHVTLSSQNLDETLPGNDAIHVQNEKDVLLRTHDEPENDHGLPSIIVSSEDDFEIISTTEVDEFDVSDLHNNEPSTADSLKKYFGYS
ncbi:uncharacterized protein LOC124440298 [Xenia sp. Carnegie-2017]|uniref:uncharacterized protein LOC124440298 n=1 Tax=Xenia sp. Carnegie-2017 TaxID=2897299 RepID=UPI001F0502E3|nr:uncharacterized protein LOC124440298 [Xenia sp. Carnegie-2017]